MKTIDGYSDKIENFLNFLRDCEEKNRLAALEEIEMDSRTQDILHNIELNENSQYDYICQGFTLAEIRKRRRKAKDTKEITYPICTWLHENQKVINTLEQLLGTVRKAEKRTQNRTYKNKTKIMNGLLE